MLAAAPKGDPLWGSPIRVILGFYWDNGKEKGNYYRV